MPGVFGTRHMVPSPAIDRLRHLKFPWCRGEGFFRNLNPSMLTDSSMVCIQYAYPLEYGMYSILRYSIYNGTS